jgi:stage V sporulation protein AE
MQSLFQSSDGGIEGMIYLYAFLTGGVICAIVQIIMSTSKIQPGNIMVGLVCTGAFLGALGIYEPFREWAGAGASVPLLGFGNVLYRGVKEEIDANGFIGIFSGGFKASAVGISAALVLGYLASLIFRPKLKK